MGSAFWANYSEQCLLSDQERDTLVDLCLSHVAGREPVMVRHPLEQIHPRARACLIELAREADPLALRLRTLILPAMREQALSPAAGISRAA